MTINLAQLREGVDGAVLAEKIDQIIRAKEVKRSILSNAKDACKPHDEHIARVRAQILDLGMGISKEALNFILEEQELQRRLTDLRGRLDEDTSVVVDVLREEMGDFGETPLGRHAGGLRLVASAG